MSQIVGRSNPKVANATNPGNNEYLPVTVIPYDAFGTPNGALVTTDFPLPITRRIDSTNPSITYVGMAAPSIADPANPVWLIQRITDDGAGNTIVEHAYIPEVPPPVTVPPTPPTPASYARAEHIWNDRVTLAYA